MQSPYGATKLNPTGIVPPAADPWTRFAQPGCPVGGITPSPRARRGGAPARAGGPKRCGGESPGDSGAPARAGGPGTPKPTRRPSSGRSRARGRAGATTRGKSVSATVRDGPNARYTPGRRKPAGVNQLRRQSSRARSGKPPAGSKNGGQAQPQRRCGVQRDVRPEPTAGTATIQRACHRQCAGSARDEARARAPRPTLRGLRAPASPSRSALPWQSGRLG